MAFYSMEGSQEDGYPNTTVLINKLGIQDQSELNSVERQFVLLKSSQAEQETIFKNIDFNFYKELHKQLFGDLYEWAGTVRSMNISKKGTVFCNFEDIERIVTVMDNYPKLFNLVHKVLAGDWLVDATEEASEANKDCIIQIMNQSPMLFTVKRYDE